MQQQKPISHISAALVISGILIVYSLAFYFLDLYSNRALGWVGYFLLFAGIILFVNLYGKANNYSKTFGGLFSYGFKTTVVVTLISIAFALLFHFLFPEFKEKMMVLMQEEMAKDEKLNSADVEKAMQMVNKFYLIGVVGGSLLFTLIFGTLASLLGAAITKKNKANPMDQLSI